MPARIYDAPPAESLFLDFCALYSEENCMFYLAKFRRTVPTEEIPKRLLGMLRDRSDAVRAVFLTPHQFAMLMQAVGYEDDPRQEIREGLWGFSACLSDASGDHDQASGVRLNDGLDDRFERLSAALDLVQSVRKGR